MNHRLVFALAVLALSYSATAAQTGPTSTNPDPNSIDRKQIKLDDDQARRFMDNFALCVAGHQPRKAAALLALPYGSKEQHRAAADLASGESDCLGPFTGALQLGFDAPSLASGFAEYFLTHLGKVADIRAREPRSFTYTPPVGIELFGECVVGQNPSAVEALAKSPVASGTEIAATDALMSGLQHCVSQGQTLALDRTALRQLLTVSFYKHLAIPPPPQPAVATAATQR